MIIEVEPLIPLQRANTRDPSIETPPFRAGRGHFRLSLRWLLIVAGILLFWVALLLDPQGFDPVVIGGFLLPQRDLGISMGSLVAFKPSGKGLLFMLKNPKPFWA
jgi:hypothetical protein